MSCEPLDLLDVATRHWGEQPYLWLVYVGLVLLWVGIFAVQRWQDGVLHRMRMAHTREIFEHQQKSEVELVALVLDARDQGLTRGGIERALAEGRKKADAQRLIERRVR